MIIGKKQFDTKNHTYIMGILNATPDSFYDGGKYNSIDAALFRAEQMIAEGADIIDVGGESTRPGFTPVSESEEIDRVADVIAVIKARFDIPVSIDTYKAVVAKAAIQAGADVINDVCGLKKDEKMAAVIAAFGAACVITHNGNNSRLCRERDGTERGEVTGCLIDIIEDLKTQLLIAEKAEIAKDKIILDPGIGFGKTVEQNLSCVANLDKFSELGYPLLLGASNKSVIGAVLNLPPEERLYGTLAATAAAVLKGASFVRVHDVKANKQVVEMTQAIKGAVSG